MDNSITYDTCTLALYLTGILMSLISFIVFIITGIPTILQNTAGFDAIYQAWISLLLL